MNEKIAAPVEFTDAYFTVAHRWPAHREKRYRATRSPRCREFRYGFLLKEGTTRRQAEKLSEMLGQHCDMFFAGFLYPHPSLARAIDG